MLKTSKAFLVKPIENKLETPGSRKYITRHIQMSDLHNHEKKPLETSYANYSEHYLVLWRFSPQIIWDPLLTFGHNKYLDLYTT